MKKVPIYSHEVLDKNRNPASGTKRCCFHSCDQEGIYPAPKPRPYIRERYWFCLEHVRRYNASWNYFSGMSDNEVETYQQSAMAGHRPTWKMGVPPAIATEQILNQVFHMFDGGNATVPAVPSIPKAEREALALLDLTYPVTLKEIKLSYKKLAKRYHPDVNNNDKQAQEKFIAVTDAYNCLMNSGFFLP